MSKPLPPNIQKIKDGHAGCTTLTKLDLAAIVADRTGMTKDVAYTAVNTVLEALADSFLAGKGMQFRGFGSFVVKLTAATVGRNPHRPEESVDIPERWVIKFKPSKIVKALLQKSMG